MKPSIGRIVHVYDKDAATPRGNGGPFAAIITEVHGPHCVTVSAFYPMGAYAKPYSSIAHKEITNGAEPYWEWPPKVD